MRDHPLIKSLKNSQRTPFVTNLLHLLHNNLERAQANNNLFAMAQILQEAIVYTSFSNVPSNEHEIFLYKQLIGAYEYLVQHMDEKQANAEKMIKGMSAASNKQAAERALIMSLPSFSIAYQCTAKNPRKLHQAVQLVRASLVLHHYFIEELKNHLEKKSIRAEYKLSYCAALEEIVLAKQGLFINKPTPENKSRFDWNLAQHECLIKNHRYHQAMKFGIFTELPLAQNNPHYFMPTESFQEKIDDIRKLHKIVCNKNGLRYGTLELLAEQIRNGSLNTHAIPSIETAFEEIHSDPTPPKSPRTFILEQITPETSYIRSRWLTQLAQEKSFSEWSGKSSESAGAHAKKVAAICFIGALVLTVAASLIIGRITVGPVNWLNPDWDTLRKVSAWFESKLGAYLLANTLAPATIALAAYQWRKNEYTFKQNTIMSYKTQIKSLPQ